jgi:hypothetical protein
MDDVQEVNHCMSITVIPMFTQEMYAVKRVNFKQPYERELQINPLQADFAETSMFTGMSIIMGALSVLNHLSIYKTCA